jgi:hypothetical protein
MFYESRQTGPEFVQWLFDADQLVNIADTQDEQRAHTWLTIHPAYMNKEKVKYWLLGLKLTDELFMDKDNKLPNGCGSKSRYSFGGFFDESLERYAFFGDEEGLAEIEAHLSKLEAEIDAREVKKDDKKEEMQSWHPEEEKRKIEEETQVERLERMLEEEQTRRERAEDEVAKKNAIIEQQYAAIVELKKTQ